MPENPKCQKDINELVNPIDGKSAWEGEPPLWENIVKRRDEILRENRELIESKKSAYRKLGMTEEEKTNYLADQYESFGGVFGEGA